MGWFSSKKWEQEARMRLARQINQIEKTQAMLVKAVKRMADEHEISRVANQLSRKEEPRSEIKEWLPMIDRMQEIALVAMGNPDLAQQFGLTTRQKEVAAVEAEEVVPVTWGEGEPKDSGVTYGA